MNDTMNWYEKAQTQSGRPEIKVSSNDVYLDVKIGKGYLGHRYTADGAAEAMMEIEKLISDLQDVRNVLDGIRQELR